MAETIRIEIPIETIDETEPELSNLIKKLGKAGKEADKFGESASKANKKVSKFDASAEKTQKSLAKWAKEKYEVYLEAKEQITPVLQALGHGIRGIAGRTWHVSMRAIDLATAPIKGILNLLKNPIFQVGAVLGVSIGLKDTVDTYKDFEAAMSQVKAISGATGTEFEELNAKAQEMGATTKFTATESAEAFNYMAMAGWKTKDMLDGIEGILSLAAASGEDLSTTSDIVTDALTAFGLTAADSGHFADVLAQASASANTNVSMLGESFKYVAPVAGAMKYSVEDVSLALGLMANSSVKGSMAGTALKTSLANMASPTKNMYAAMEKYNISLEDGHGKMKTLKGVMDNLRKELGGLSEAEQTAAASTIFGKEAMAGMLSIINASEKDYKNLTKAVNNADGASKNMADTMLDNLEGSITLLQSAVDGVKISLGKRLSPYVRGTADWLTEMMPDVEVALDGLMDFVDRKISKMQDRFHDISSTAEWQDADFFGKAKIAWDEFIAEPFAEWWGSTGKAKIAGALGDFGEMLGSGLHVGIMTLLGIDVEDTTNEAVSIGKQFAKGFSDGFDFNEISKKLWEGLGNMVKNAGKLLPGGEAADLSSLMSAVMLAKIAKPVAGFGSGTVELGKAVFGKQEAFGGISLFSKMMGSTGNAMVGGSGLLGKMADVGYSLSNTSNAGLYFGSTAGSMSGGAAAALGGVSIAGGVLGAAGLIHGGMDIYTAAHTDDSEKAKAYRKAGAVEIVGTGAGALAGAATGAALGSVIPIAGTAAGALIGAGVGAVGSWIAGNKIKEDYEEEAQERNKALANQQKAYAVLGRDIDDVRFKSKKLNDAMHDAEVSTEEFAVMYQEEVAGVLKSHFGDVSLSLEEIKKTADSVVFGKQKGKFEEYAQAADNTASSLDALDRSITELNKQNWRAGLGTKMDDTEIVNYQSAMDEFAQNAKTYLANTHYEATLSVGLLFGKKGGADITEGFDKTYAGMEQSLEKLSKKLSNKVEKALEDGVINAKEQKAITKLQKKITNLTDKMSDARGKASRDALKAKYSNGDLDYASFESLQQELAADSQQKAQEYYNAMVESYAALELQKDSMSDKKYQKRHDEISERYQKETSALGEEDISFQLDFLKENYSKELEGILPDLKGTIQDRLKEAMTEAFVVEPDAAKWDSADMARWFGLEGLETGAQDAIITMIKQIAESVPEEAKEIMTDKFKKGILEAGMPTGKEILEQAGDMGFAEFNDFMASHVGAALEQAEKGTAGTAKNTGGSVGDNVITSAQESITKGSGIIRGAMESSVAAAAVMPFSPSIQITPNYSITPPSMGRLFEGWNKNIGSAGGSGKGSSGEKIGKNAAGGYVSNKQLSWLAEEGYGEFVIPTNPSRRGRALELYEQAGRMLGVGEHANGGFITPHGDIELASYMAGSGSNYLFPDETQKGFPSGSNEATGAYYNGKEPCYPAASPENDSSGNGQTVQINIQLSPEFVINNTDGQGGQDTAALIKRYIMEMADDLSDEIAGRLADVFSNTPVKEA